MLSKQHSQVDETKTSDMVCHTMKRYHGFNYPKICFISRWPVASFAHSFTNLDFFFEDFSPGRLEQHTVRK